MFLVSRAGVIAATLCLIGLSAAGFAYVRVTKPQPGLQASVFRNASFAGVPLSVTPDASLSVDARASAAGLPDSVPFSVDWTGWVFIERSGNYLYKLEVDDGVTIWIGERAVVDVTGAPGVYTQNGALTLQRGVHPIQIRYVQYTGGRHFKFTWNEPGRREEFVTPAYFQPGQAPLTLTAVELDRRLPLAVALAWCGWIGAMLAALFWRGAALGRPWRGLSTRELAAGGLVLGICLALMMANLTWGLFPLRAWHPEELTPADLANAASVRFSQGWNHVYPPLHFFLSALVMAPVMLGEKLHVVSYADPAVLGAFHVGERLISLGMAALTLVMAFMIGRITIGRSRAMIAVLIAGTTQVFTFYAKTANLDVPYVMWVTAATLFYLRAAKDQRLGDFVRLGAAAACAITTKDQAFGFFAGPAAVLLWFSWRRRAAGSSAQRLMRTVLDARLWAGAVTFGIVLVLGYGLPWNYEGFMAHVATATGWRVQGFRMFDNSLAGQAGLFALSLKLLPWVMGVVPTVMAIAGLWVAAARWRRFRWLWVAMVPIISYYVTVIMTIGYIYDRFVLAWLVVGAQLAALGVDRLLRLPRMSATMRWSVATACTVAVLVPAVHLNATMASGSRDRLERWLAANAGDNPLLLATGNALYLPKLAGYRHVVLNAPDEEIASWQADVIILNEDWLKRVNTPRSAMVAAMVKASYLEVFRDLPAPRPWWVTMLTGSPPREDVTNLMKLSPAYTVWKKTGRD